VVSVAERLIHGRLRVLFVLVKQSQHLLEDVFRVALPHFFNRGNCCRVNILNGFQSSFIKSGLKCMAAKEHIKESNRFVLEEFSSVFVMKLQDLASLNLILVDYPRC